jgi:hypothetical protein
LQCHISLVDITSAAGCRLPNRDSASALRNFGGSYPFEYTIKVWQRFYAELAAKAKMPRSKDFGIEDRPAKPFLVMAQDCIIGIVRHFV